jgi:hypothetical protein
MNDFAMFEAVGSHSIHFVANEIAFSTFTKWKLAYDKEIA